MATKVVKGFKEKVINTAMCLDLRKIRSKQSFEFGNQGAIVTTVLRGKGLKAGFSEATE